MTEDYNPSDMAAETMLGDLMQCVVEQCRALQSPWQQLPENQQQEALDRMERQCSLAISKAVHIIASHDRPHMRAVLKYDDGRKLVIDTGKCTISSIQRHLRIGYNRAARMVEALEANDVVSPPEANGSRKILVSE